MLKIFSLIFLTTLTASVVAADQFPVPDGDVILTISGDIKQTNVGDTLQFDYKMLCDLDHTTIKTSTIWTDGPHAFHGVSLHAISQLFNAKDGTLWATAINNYTVQIPLSDATEDGPIIAYKMDGAHMSVRDKGPLWIIYPYDKAAKFRSDVIYSRSVWQLDRLEVVK